MLQKISDFFTNAFGNAGKWVMLGIAGVILVIAIVLVVFVAINIKYIIIAAVIVAVLAIAGISVAKKLKQKQ